MAKKMMMNKKQMGKKMDKEDIADMKKGMYSKKEEAAEGKKKKKKKK